MNKGDLLVTTGFICRYNIKGVSLYLHSTSKLLTKLYNTQ